MGTIIFLTITLGLFFSGKKKASLLLFCIMAYRYIALLPMSLMELNGDDGATIYMVVVSIANYSSKRIVYKEDRILRRHIKVFFLFLLLSILFSLFYYCLSPIQILMGIRLQFLFLSYFFIRSVPVDDVLWIMKVLYHITFIHALLYIAQFVFQIPLLGVAATEDPLTGKLRYYNFPMFNIFFLVLSLFYPKYFEAKVSKWAPVVFMGAQFCSLGRTSILGMLIIIVLGMFSRPNAFSGQNKKFTMRLLILLIACIPFYGLVSTRMGNDGTTAEDLSGTLSGDASIIAETGNLSNGANTFTYRIAWILERGYYMVNGSIGEQCFGLGWYAPKDNTLAYKRYHFNIGLPADDGNPEQLSSPDISYGNIITHFGFLGGFLYLLIWIRLLILNFKNRQEFPLSHAMALFLIFWILEGMAGTSIYVCAHLILPLMITHITLATKQLKNDKRQ